MTESQLALKRRYPGWRITRGGNMTLGWYLAAYQLDEQPQPPVFTYDQLQRGLRRGVAHAIPSVLDELTAEQIRLREELNASREPSFHA